MGTITLMLAVGVIVVGLLLLASRPGKRRCQAIKDRAYAHMSGRPSLSAQEFAAKSFAPDVAPVALGILEILSKHLPVDLSRMHRTDRLVADLQMDTLDSMSTLEFVMEIEERFSIKIPDKEANATRTFAEIIVYVANLKRTAGTA